LSVHGDSIYGTRAGTIRPPADGSAVSTCKDETHYVHVLDYLSDCVALRDVPDELAKAALVKDGSPVDFVRPGETAVLTIQPQQREEADTVIRLER
jgi:alpha-L-fucosidase